MLGGQLLSSLFGKTGKFPGGVHPDEHKLSTGLPIQKLPLPQRLYLPLQQHIGSPAEPVIAIGARVLKSELLARPGSGLSAPIHAPTSGHILAIEAFTAPHPSGLPVDTIILEPDGLDEACDAVLPLDPMTMEPEVIAERVGEAGIVGMGGAAFPAAVKLNLGAGRVIHTLIINGGECEPYLTCDVRLMQERPDAVLEGIRLMQRAIGAGAVVLAIENNKPQAFEAMQAVAEPFADIRVEQVPTRYPMGSEKQMIQALLGLEVPAGKLGADIGVIVHNVATAHAVQQALRLGQPLTSRIVTVSGGAIANPANLEVPLGTLASELVAFCGGLTEEPARLLLGGPMMGHALPHLDIPIVKGSNGLLALNAAEVGQDTGEQPCIRCSRCVEACPLGLLPLEMAARVRNGDVEAANDFGLADCISCGSCSYTCPADIPMTHYFNYAKGELTRRRLEKAKSEETRALAQARQARMERLAAEKKAKAAKRKAERDAKKKAAAEAAAKAEAETETGEKTQ